MVMALGLSACGGDEPEPSSSSEAEAPDASVPPEGDSPEGGSSGGTATVTVEGGPLAGTSEIALSECQIGQVGDLTDAGVIARSAGSDIPGISLVDTTGTFESDPSGLTLLLSDDLNGRVIAGADTEVTDFGDGKLSMTGTTGDGSAYTLDVAC